MRRDEAVDYAMRSSYGQKGVVFTLDALWMEWGFTGSQMDDDELFHYCCA